MSARIPSKNMDVDRGLSFIEGTPLRFADHKASNVATGTKIDNPLPISNLILAMVQAVTKEEENISTTSSRIASISDSVSTSTKRVRKGLKSGIPLK